MLWYVEQAVPDPRCTLASTICPSVNALVPQVYLPEGYAQALAVPTGGTISGENIKLSVDGQLRNTGQVVARDTLTVKAESIDLSPNVVSIGTNAYKAQGGWNVVTGTVVQPGGFLSAMHMDIEADSIRAINDAFRVTRADGTVDADASAALVAQLKESLGLNYTEGTVADDIHTQFIKEKKGFGILGQILAMAAAVAVSIVTAGSAAAAMGVALAKMTLGEAILVAALSSMAGSMASQIVSGQGLNFGKIAQAGLIGAVTAGLTNGITFDGSSFGLSEWGQSLEGTRTLANLAGSNTAGGVLQAAKDGATGTIYQQAIGMVGTGLINAGINTAFNGGSFGQAFLNNLVAQTAALGANAIGNSTDPLTLQNVAAHAALGCAAQSAMGGDCGSGAIGGATSAVVAPLVRDGLYDGSQSVTTTVNGDGTVTTTTSYDNRVYNAATAAIAMLAGGALAGALGRDATAAAGAAQNEALNNAMSAKTRTLMNRAYSFEGQPASALNAADIRQTILELNVAAQDPNLTVQERNWLHNAALNAYIAGGQAGVLPVGDLGLTYNALISSMGFSGGGVASLPSGRAQDNVLSTTTGSRTAVTLGGDKSSNVGFDTSNLESKLSGYLLVAAHPQNQTKANWFSQALGFDRSNWQDLASQLRFDPATAVATKTTQYGKTYEQVIPITGANGKTINTTFVFMRDNSGTVRFVTGIPTKK
jgi:filamentous hemagglutinin